MNTAVAMFRERYPEFAALAIDPIERGLRFGSDDEGGLALVESEDRWTVDSRIAHAHCGSLAEALGYVAELLRADLVEFEEYRDDQIARSWFEDPSAAAEHGQLHLSVFLSPFDADDWEPWPGDTWRTIRRTRTFNPATGQVTLDSAETTTESTSGRSMKSLSWLDEGLGNPEKGLKWIVAAHRRFVLQAPAGWRRYRDDEGEESHYHNYLPQSQEFVFRVGAVFRDAENPHDVEEGRALSPKSIERSIDDQNDVWWSHHWRPIFSDGYTDMMGLIYLYFRPGETESVEPYRAGIDSAVGKSLMAPTEWDMTTTDW